jgi:hypothetical protein
MVQHDLPRTSPLYHHPPCHHVRHGYHHPPSYLGCRDLRWLRYCVSSAICDECLVMHLRELQQGTALTAVRACCRSLALLIVTLSHSLLPLQRSLSLRLCSRTAGFASAPPRPILPLPFALSLSARARLHQRRHRPLHPSFT